MTGSQQAPESSLLLKGNYERRKSRVGFVCIMQNKCITGMRAKFAFLATVLTSMLDQEQIISTRSYELIGSGRYKETQKEE